MNPDLQTPHLCVHGQSLHPEIRLAVTTADRAAIARLRYEVYVEEMGRNQAEADHAERRVYEALDEGAVLVGAFLPDGRAVGTLRIIPSSACPHGAAEFYGWQEREREFPGQVCLGSKLMVAREFRGSRMGFELICTGTRAAMQKGYRFWYWDANEHLVAFYRRLGAQARAHREHPLFGPVTVMEWDCHDLEHLRRIRSPLLPACAESLAHQPAA